MSRKPMMRDLITAFSAEARQRMTSAGWRKHTGDVFTLDLGHGFFAWLGLNRATKYHPLEVNPVMGLRYEPLEDLISDLFGEKPTRLRTATLSSPIGYLTPQRMFLQLEIASIEDALPAADKLRDLVHKYGLPIAQQHANPDAVLVALHTGTPLANHQRPRILIPALHLLHGDIPEARRALHLGQAAYTGTDSLAARHYQRFADALNARLDQAS
jgi:hypothetical protein